MTKKKSDITAKISCLVIAIFLWSFVMSEVNPVGTTQYKNVVVNLGNVSALERQGLVVMEPQKVTVNIEVTGKKSERDKFSSSNIVANVDLSGYSEGHVKIPVLASLTDQTSGITISNVEPKEILFTFDKLITKEMPITISTTGTLGEGYVAGDITSKSQSILISGPRTWVNEVNKVLAVISLDGRTGPETLTVATVILDDEGNEVRGVTKQPNLVDVNIPIYRTISLPIELQTINQLPENYSITDIFITPSNVRVKGNNDIINLKKIDTMPIDINTLLDKSALEVELDLPEGIELLNPDEKITIIYNVEETILKEFTLSLREINILNIDRNLEITEDDLSSLIKVTLKGYKTLIDALENKDLKLSIDLNGLTEGRNDIDIKIDEIQGITVEKIAPQPLSINLVNP